MWNSFDPNEVLTKVAYSLLFIRLMYKELEKEKVNLWIFGDHKKKMYLVNFQRHYFLIVKGIILSSFIHPWVVPNLYVWMYFFCWTQNNTFWRIWVTSNQTVDGPHWLLCNVKNKINTMEVNGVHQLLIYFVIGYISTEWNNVNFTAQAVELVKATVSS